MRSIWIGAFLAAFAAAGAQARPALTISPTVMRADASPRASIVQPIPANAEIDVSNCTSKWCYGSWRNIFGYIPANAVEYAAVPPPVIYAPPPVVVAPYYGGWGPWPHGGWRRRW